MQTVHGSHHRGRVTEQDYKRVGFPTCCERVASEKTAVRNLSGRCSERRVCSDDRRSVSLCHLFSSPSLFEWSRLGRIPFVVIISKGSHQGKETHDEEDDQTREEQSFRCPRFVDGDAIASLPNQGDHGACTFQQPRRAGSKPTSRSEAFRVCSPRVISNGRASLEAKEYGSELTFHLVLQEKEEEEMIAKGFRKWVRYGA